MGDNDDMALLTSSSARREFPRWGGMVIVLALFLWLWSPPATAHGDLQSTIPEKGSKLKRPPDHLIINFTETPAKQSVVSVKDGCKDDVVDVLEFEEKVAHIFLTEGQPGKWTVSYDVISAVDGHRTDGSYTLTVTGKSDCSGKGGSGPADNGTGPGNQAEGGDGSGDGGGEDESSFPVVPVALGSVGLIALALIARRLSG